MTITSINFLAFLILGVVVYYLIPKKSQWIVLLVCSVLFYCLATNPITILYLVAAAMIAYVSTLYAAKLKAAEDTSRKAKMITGVSIVLLVLLWFIPKGTSLWSAGRINIIGALGMGYYTAQTISYILDVYWDTIKPQRNFLKLFLFIAFFPQLTVGPISRYQALEPLYAAHDFSYDNITSGFQRILWGLMKKMVLSDRIGYITSAIWADPATFTGGWPWIAVLIYPLQLYADFSGCMDIVLGTAELFDIRLAENFNTPFFSRTVQEFWQRWHITLGGWARDYLYYPVLKSDALINLGKKCKARFGKRLGKLIPWTIGMIILWTAMGVWHGTVMHVLGVGLWFCAIIVISEITQPLMKRVTDLLHINTESFGWRLFQMIRTYIFFAIGTLCFSAKSIGGLIDNLRILKHSFDEHAPWYIFEETLFSIGVRWLDIWIIIGCLLMLLTVDIIYSKKGPVRKIIKRHRIAFRWALWIGLFLLVILCGMYGPGYDASSFIYQGF